MRFGGSLANEQHQKQQMYSVTLFSLSLSEWWWDFGNPHNRNYIHQKHTSYAYYEPVVYVNLLTLTKRITMASPC